MTPPNHARTIPRQQRTTMRHPRPERRGGNIQEGQPPITAARITSVEGTAPPPGGLRASREEQAVESARELIAFADGIEDAGHPALARRARNVARETIWLAERVAAEMSARVAMQQARDRVMNMLMERAK